MWTVLSRLIGSLSVGRKLALIYFLDLTTVIFISGILINEKYIAINFTNKEIVGNDYIAVVRDALLAVVERDPVLPLGDGAASTQWAGLQASLASAEQRYGKDMGSAPPARGSCWHWRRPAWRRWHPGGPCSRASATNPI